jgi:hypothetical protein
MMAPGTFEALVRHQLRQRDQARRARLGDAVAYDAADQACVNAIMEAAGYGEPTEDAERPARKAARARRSNEDRAFGGATL